MGLLRSVHDDTLPVHPKDDPVVQAKGREVEQARAALNEIERAPARWRPSATRTTMKCTCCSPRRKARGSAPGTLRPAWRSPKRSGATMPRFKKPKARGSKLAMAAYREAAERWLTWVEDEALAMNNAMLAAQEAAERPGVRVEPLHIPYLLPDAVAHRCTVGRRGLG